MIVIHSDLTSLFDVRRARARCLSTPLMWPRGKGCGCGRSGTGSPARRSVARPLGAARRHAAGARWRAVRRLVGAVARWCGGAAARRRGGVAAWRRRCGGRGAARRVAPCRAARGCLSRTTDPGRGQGTDFEPTCRFQCLKPPFSERRRPNRGARRSSGQSLTARRSETRSL